jgi:hypothetical protein
MPALLVELRFQRLHACLDRFHLARDPRTKDRLFSTISATTPNRIIATSTDQKAIAWKPTAQHLVTWLAMFDDGHKSIGEARINSAG